MENDTYTDPLASLFRPADKPRFANLDWPIWDSDVFNPHFQALKDGDKIAFAAGTTYVREAVSLKRPKILRELLDKATLNHLARWSLKGFVIGEERASERVEEARNLLASYRSGVLLALDELRKAEVSDDVDKGDLEEVINALESYVHGHFVAMSELGPSIARQMRAEYILTQLSAMQMAEDHESDEEDEDEDEDGDEDEDDEKSQGNTTESKLKDEASAEEATASEDQEPRFDTDIPVKDNSDDERDVDKGFEYFEEIEILEEIASSGDNGEDEVSDTKSSSLADNETLHKGDATHGGETGSAMRGKRVKSKKARKAKVQTKRDKKKKVEVLDAET